ncbi:unnamed protein product, partial [Closterium sp. Naga37s-1]
NYPRLNTARCCKKGLCTDCYLRIASRRLCAFRHSLWTTKARPATHAHPQKFSPIC